MFLTSVNLIPEAPVEQMVMLARRAESLGFDRCWVYDEGRATVIVRTPTGDETVLFVQSHQGTVLR